MSEQGAESHLWDSIRVKLVKQLPAVIEALEAASGAKYERLNVISAATFVGAGMTLPEVELMDVCLRLSSSAWARATGQIVDQSKLGAETLDWLIQCLEWLRGAWDTEELFEAVSEQDKKMQEIIRIVEKYSKREGNSVTT